MLQRFLEVPFIKTLYEVLKAGYWSTKFPQQALTHLKVNQKFEDISPVSYDKKLLVVACQVRRPTKLAGLLLSQMEAIIIRYLSEYSGYKSYIYFRALRGYQISLYNSLNVYSNIKQRQMYAANLSAEDEAWLADLVSLSFSEINQVEYNNIPFGRLAIASTRRAVLKSKLESDTDRAILIENLRYGLAEYHIAKKLFDEIQPDVILTNHATYVEQGGIFFHTALSHNIPIVSWTPFGKTNLVMRYFANKEEYLHADNGISKVEWEMINAHPKRDCFIDAAKDYLNARIAGETVKMPGGERYGLRYQSGSIDDIWFEKEQPTVGVFTHLPWDASGSYYHDLYDSLADWMEDTARVALESTHLNWVFRVHPSEAAWGSVEDTESIIRSVIPEDTSHIRIISATTQISSYNLAERLVAGVTVRGSLAIELPCRGIRMICAGTGQTAVAGINHFPSSIEDYRQLLKNAHTVTPTTPSEQETAYLYVYAAFLHRMFHLKGLSDYSDLKEIAKLTPEILEQDAGLQRVKDIVNHAYHRKITPIRIAQKCQ